MDVPLESLTGNQHPSGAKVIKRPRIILIKLSDSVLVFFPSASWEVLMLKFPTYLKKSPPADTSNAAQRKECYGIG